MSRLPVFGRPEWFRPKSVGWGLTPVKWQGWVFAASWSVVTLFPFIYLMCHSLLPEAFTWVVLSLAALIREVAQILNQIAGQRQRDVDSIRAHVPAEGGQVATRHFDLQLRHEQDDGTQVERDLIQEAFNVLRNLGHSKTEARRLLDGVLGTKKQFRDVKALIQGVYQFGHGSQV